MFGQNEVAGKRAVEEGFLVHSIFYTIQGEGPFAGEPAVFVRLAGCNLRCAFCDTEFEKGSTVQTVAVLVSNIITAIGEEHLKLEPVIVITGGEPMLQPLPGLIDQLIRCGYRVQIETAGTVFPSYDGDTWIWGHPNLSIVVSPKTPKLHRMFSVFSFNQIAFKYIIKADEIDDMFTGLPMGVCLPPDGARVFVQPCDEQDEKRNKANLDAAVKSAMQFGHRLSIQLHKIAGLD